MTDVDNRLELEEFANAAGARNQPQPPSGHSLVRPTQGVADRIIGAQHVAVYRDEAKILQKLTSIAAAAGTDWFYRFPVKKRDGGQDWIEGPSIKLANDVARIFGNNSNEVREIDVGDAWVFYARFTDIETGFSMERAYRQRKSQSSLKTKDADRQLDIAYQIGQSKAIRNCIVNSLQLYADYAFEQARNSLVEKIGKDLPAWRERTMQGLAKMPVDLVRVERAMGRPAKEWLAPQIAQVIAMMKSVHDGMASLDEVFPPIEAKAKEESTSATSTPGGGEVNQGGAGSAGQQKQDGAGVPDEQTTETPEQIAHRRGAEAKASGHKATALPGEYRESNRTSEALAWRAGFDGQPVLNAAGA